MSWLYGVLNLKPMKQVNLVLLHLLMKIRLGETVRMEDRSVVARNWGGVGFNYKGAAEGDLGGVRE